MEMPGSNFPRKKMDCIWLMEMLVKKEIGLSSDLKLRSLSLQAHFIDRLQALAYDEDISL